MFFFQKDPLGTVLFIYGLIREGESIVAEAPYRLRFRESLDKLHIYLETRGDDKPDYYKTNVRLMIMGGLQMLDESQRIKAENLARQVVALGGSGSSHVEKGLLQSILGLINPESVPFWQDMLVLKRPRDRSRKLRQETALAALTLLVLHRNDQNALQTLQEACQNKDAFIRQKAIECLAAISQVQGKEQTITPAMIERLKDTAANDKSFSARFEARLTLDDCDIAIPLDHPGQVYHCRVSFLHDREKQMYHTIAIRSDDTLYDLHMAIQDALYWDDDHLYSFYLGDTKSTSDAYEFSVPDFMDEMGFMENRPVLSVDIQLGALGLRKKQSFTYLFDFGDNHEFLVEVVDIRPADPKETYPAVVESKGEAPPQYGWYDEDDDEWYDDDEEEQGT